MHAAATGLDCSTLMFAFQSVLAVQKKKKKKEAIALKATHVHMWVRMV